MYTTTNNALVHGGMATIGPLANTYFSILSTPTIPANVKKLTTGGTVLWTFNGPGVGPGYDMYAIPALNAAGAKLYIGSDAGIFYCLNTTDGSTNWSYTVTNGTDKRIRSGAALDPNNPLGSTVYFHCNNGYLYALDADTGAQRWNPAHTANEGGPPTAPDSQAPGGNWDPQPVSSSPAVDSSGVVYVGSADGSVYSFNPSTGAQNWRLPLNDVATEPVEGSIAIGQNGILYVGTRVNTNTLDGGTMYAINPVTHTKVWTQPLGNAVGFIASPVIDQAGFIYASHFDHTVNKLNPGDGTVAQAWRLPGKVCLTPAINQNGLLIIGVSAMSDGEINEVAAIKIGDHSSSAPYWVITQAGGQNLGNTLGSPAIRCIAQGTTYVADMLGKVFRFDTGAAMMAGQWPTFQCGNRRAGKSATYPTAISDLGPFAGSYNSLTSVKSVDALGRAAGQSYGYYKYACGDSATLGYSAAMWQNRGILNPGGCALAAPSSFATALTARGA